MNPYKNTPLEIPKAREMFEIFLYIRGYTNLELNKLEFREGIIRQSIPTYTTSEFGQ